MALRRANGAPPHGLWRRQRQTQHALDDGRHDGAWRGRCDGCGIHHLDGH